MHQISYIYNNQGCISSEVQEITVENCVSLQELESVYKIWPNPFEDEIQIELPMNTKFSLINLQGQVILNGFCEASGIVKLDLSNLHIGMYYFLIEHNSKSSTMPIMKR
jgi:hypothetical protein